ncbi:MAG: hypothetical protein D6705_08105 [Deltaproteobacteria bacterium]|nr:MAG: hypothetical protein D6705_08105 [Deltaproteobacteria bacterium]
MAALWPAADAGASDSKPRTPPSFGATPCLVEVDRSVDPQLVLTYGLPLEDPQGAMPPLPDHRTHQLFLLCKDTLPDETPPPWIDLEDVMRADDAGLLGTMPAPEDVLDTSAAYRTGHDGTMGTCAVAVVPKEARRPIVCSSAADPVTFDTSALPAGGYVLWGYTFEPDINLWTRRLGVVWIHDGDGSAPPAAALSVPWYQGTRVYVGDPFVLRGCAAGPPGTTVTIARATVADAAVSDAFVDVAEFVLDGAGCDVEATFVPGEADAGQAWVFRIRARAPGGEVFDGYAPGKLLVLPGEGATDPGGLPTPLEICGVELDGTDVAPSCPAGTTTGPGTTDTSGASATSGEPTGSDDGAATGGSSAGCGCRLPVAPSSALGILGLAGLCAVRRRPASGTRRP